MATFDPMRYAELINGVLFITQKSVDRAKQDYLALLITQGEYLQVYNAFLAQQGEFGKEQPSALPWVLGGAGVLLAVVAIAHSAKKGR